MCGCGEEVPGESPCRRRATHISAPRSIAEAENFIDYKYRLRFLGLGGDCIVVMKRVAARNSERLRNQPPPTSTRISFTF